VLRARTEKEFARVTKVFEAFGNNEFYFEDLADYFEEGR
jgi:hypothetical protein